MISAAYFTAQSIQGLVWFGAHKEAWCRSSVKRSLSLVYGEKKCRFAIFRLLIYDIWTNSWPLSKSEKNHVKFSRIFILERDVRVPQDKTARLKISKYYFFWMLYQTRDTQSLCFVLPNVVPQKSHVHPKKYCFWDELGSLGLHGASLSWNGIAQNENFWVIRFW